MSTETKNSKKTEEQKVGFWTRTKNWFKKPAVVNTLIGTAAFAAGTAAGMAYEKRGTKK
jgi:hypothetical protein